MLDTARSMGCQQLSTTFFFPHKAAAASFAESIRSLGDLRWITIMRKNATQVCVVILSADYFAELATSFSDTSVMTLPLDFD